jgi:ferritin heavy chain
VFLLSSVEYNNMYVYHSLAAYFDRDDVGLPGFAAYFKHNSDEEREHANKLMVQQNRRGGRVKLQVRV